MEEITDNIEKYILLPSLEGKKQEFLVLSPWLKKNIQNANK